MVMVRFVDETTSGMRDEAWHLEIFEGDRMLGVILSKALLLANDTRITDPTITSQIRR